MAFHLNKPKSPSPKDALYKFWSKLPSGSGDNDENVKSYRREDGRTDDGPQAIIKAHLSFQHGLAKTKVNAIKKFHF